MTRPTVLAYYFPNWHNDPQNAERHGDGWNEWKLLREARPRFPTHRQPRVPTLGYTDEADPQEMADQIQLAADHGVDAFLFDYYWHDNGPFLSGALDDGYLGAANRSKLQFALMWANHDWLDIFPAHTGVHAPLKDGAIARPVFDAMVDHIIDAYFSQPEYLKLDGKPFFSIYEIGSLIEGLGGVDNTREALRDFEAKTIAAGHAGLHLDATVWGFGVLPSAVTVAEPTDLITRLGFDSASSYVWIHHSDVAASGFPLGDWDRVANDAVTEYERYVTELDVPFIPNATVGWDASPRTAQDEPFHADEYPWYPVFESTPDQFRRGLERIVDIVARQNYSHPMITVNAWNEWTEGSALLPEKTYGLGFLEAIRSVVGTRLDEPALSEAVVAQGVPVKVDEP
jgi:hypothetical protein